MVFFLGPMWNVFHANIQTNNSVEGWHYKLNRTLGFHHPNAFELVEVLKIEQAAVESMLLRA